MSGTVTGLDLDRLEELAEKATPSGDWIVTEPGQCCNGSCMTDIDADGPIHDSDARYADLAFIAAMRNAVPSLLAAARANARIEAMVAVWEADEREHLMRFGQHIPCSLATLSEAVRAALGTEQEGRD